MKRNFTKFAALIFALCLGAVSMTSCEDSDTSSNVSTSTTQTSKTKSTTTSATTNTTAASTSAASKELDPFDCLKVSYNGIAPFGTIELKADNIPVSGFKFKADKKDGLSNGDTVKVTFGDNTTEKVCLDKGYKLTSTEKQYKVEGLRTYAQKIEDIPQKTLDKLDSHAKDFLKANIGWEETDWSTYQKAEFLDMELIGYYFLTPKDPSFYSDNGNIIYLIYKNKAKDGDGEFTYYYYSSFKDLVLLPDGTCSVDISKMEYPYDAIYDGEAFYRYDGWYGIWGFEELDSLFDRHITKNIDKWNYVSTVKE